MFSWLFIRYWIRNRVITLCFFIITFSFLIWLSSIKLIINGLIVIQKTLNTQYQNIIICLEKIYKINSYEIISDLFTTNRNKWTINGFLITDWAFKIYPDLFCMLSILTYYLFNAQIFSKRNMACVDFTKEFMLSLFNSYCNQHTFDLFGSLPNAGTDTAKYRVNTYLWRWYKRILYNCLHIKHFVVQNL